MALKTTRRQSSRPPRVTSPARHVLFLCSGNYYRSRYAEALFNHLARAEGWSWRAFSRGLSTHLVEDEISTYTRQHLLRRGIALRQTAPAPRALTRSDLVAAAHVVALKESEHLPVMRARFPGYASQVEYWKIHDLDAGTPADTLAAIDLEVRRLARRLGKK
ncbi:MAG TPA: hypothetical protein VK737_01805 [Opitutales bacterium]|jgi:protein-tyrosine phosphatase|nr:hypothetical protein [Opitutales bacterium]